MESGNNETQLKLALQATMASLNWLIQNFNLESTVQKGI